MGVTGEGKSIDAILRRRPDSHPFAIPVAPGAQGIWLIRVTPTPIGYVLKRSESGGFVYDAYAHCRDQAGKRPWLKTFQTFNSAVAWAAQHERDIHQLIADMSPEPEQWPPSASLAEANDRGADVRLDPGPIVRVRSLSQLPTVTS